MGIVPAWVWEELRKGQLDARKVRRADWSGVTRRRERWSGFGERQAQHVLSCGGSEVVIG